MQPNIWKLAFGTIGNMISVAVILSPVPTFYTIIKRGSTEDFSGLPYLCGFFNALLWFLYGLPFITSNGLLILTINGFGFALELSYILIFIVFAIKEKKIEMMRWMVAVLVAYVAEILVVIFGIHSLGTRQIVAGSMCVIVNVLMYASPLSIIGMVIRTRSVEYMPFLLSLCKFANSAVWLGYSFVTKDIFTAVPNGLGCLASIAQLVLYATYKNAKPIIKTKVEAKHEAITPTHLSTTVGF